MKRKDVLGLRDQIWFKPLENDPLEVSIVPSATGLIMGPFAANGNSADVACTKAFVNFRNYFEDDGVTAVPNTLAARKELWDVAKIQHAIVIRLAEAQAALDEGEAGAASE